MWFPPCVVFKKKIIFTFLFLAPALCYTSQLVMLLPQLPQTLPFLLQAGLQLQNQNLKTNRISLAIQFWVFSSYNKQTKKSVGTLTDFFLIASRNYKNLKREVAFISATLEGFQALMSWHKISSLDFD